MNKNVELFSHYADICAIPCFALLVAHFYNMETRTPMENLLYLFSISGLILDIIFSYSFLIDYKNRIKTI